MEATEEVAEVSAGLACRQVGIFLVTSNEWMKSRLDDFCNQFGPPHRTQMSIPSARVMWADTFPLPSEPN